MPDVIGYRTGVIQSVVESLRAVWPESVAYGDYRLDTVMVDIEYPMEQKSWPYVMVDFEEGDVYPNNLDGFMIDDDTGLRYQRWVFDGTISFGLYSLRAYERDMLTDGLFVSLGMSEAFKDLIRANEYIRMEVNNKDFTKGPSSATPGTPWDSDEVVYFREYSIKVQGEFVTDTVTSGLVSLVKVYPRLEGEPDLPDNTEGAWQ